MWLCLALFLIPAIVFGADPCPDCKVDIVVDDVSGGLNTTLPSYKLPPGYSRKMRNVFIDQGKIETVGGFTVVGSTTALANGAFISVYNKVNGSKEFILSDSSAVYSTVDYNTYVKVSTGLNNSFSLDCAQIYDKVWCTNGTDPVFTWNGTNRVNLDGTNGTPNVPKGRFIEFYQERPFLFNVLNDESALVWADVKSTNNVAIAPDSFLAWPAANKLQIGQGDGQLGSALFSYNNRLYIGKERSIHVLQGNGTLTYNAVKVEPQVGIISNDSVQVLDGIAYFKGLDGIYAFTGGQATRISDDIIPDIAAMLNPTNKIVKNTWDTQSDFSNGQFVGSTATANGLLQIQSFSPGFINNTGATRPSGDYIKLTDTGTAFTDFAALVTTALFPQSFYGVPYFDGSSIWARQIDLVNGGVGACTKEVRLEIRNGRTGDVQVIQKFFNGGADFSKRDMSKSSLISGGVFFTQDDLKNSSFTIKVTTTQTWGNCEFDFYSTTITGNAELSLSQATTGQFMSEVSTVSSAITGWGTIESLRNTNGASVNYFVRTSTSSVNITTQSWVAINPGVNINAGSANNYVQWASTITSPATIDNVLINHVEGSASLNRAFAATWKNRLWVAVATETSGNFSLIYVKSLFTNRNPKAWMPIEGINVRSFAKDGNSTFYAGAASTGVFYRLDYGTNFNGLPINPYYETSDIFMGDIFHEKELYEYYLIADRENGNTLTLGVSVGTGTFTTTSIDMGGSGRMVKTFEAPKGKRGKYFNWRFENLQLDKSLNVLGFGVLNKNTGVRVSKFE